MTKCGNGQSRGAGPCDVFNDALTLMSVLAIDMAAKNRVYVDKYVF